MTTSNTCPFPFPGPKKVQNMLVHYDFLEKYCKSMLAVENIYKIMPHPNFFGSILYHFLALTIPVPSFSLNTTLHYLKSQ